MASVFVPELKNPNYPCDTDRPKAVGEYLISRNFLERDEHVRSLVRANGEGRNAVWRVETSTRSFVVKQFQSWPANGRACPSADDRYQAECQFYRTARISDGINRGLAVVLHQDRRAGCVILEDVGHSDPAVPALSVADAEALGWFLVSLHHHSQSVPASAHYRNRAVLGWQMAHLFHRDYSHSRKAPGRWLARFTQSGEPARYALEDAMAALEQEESSLVHGDFTAANWVRSAEGTLRVVDAEFSFFGPPEFDAGAFLASLLYTRQAPEIVRVGIAVIAHGCLRYRARLTAAYVAVHLCAMLDHDAHAGTGSSVAAARAVLRRVARAAEQRTLEVLVPAAGT